MGRGAFTPDVMRRIHASTGLKLHGVLASQQQANVGARIHPRVPRMLTAFYGLESRLDLWDLDRGRHIQALQIRGEGNAEATGVMMITPQGPVSGAALPIRDLALSPSGHMVALACGKQVRLVAVEAGGDSIEELIELDGQQSGVHGVAFSHSGEMLVSACDDGKLVVWNVAEFRKLSTFALPEARLRCLSFSSDDLLVAAGDTEGNVAVWDVVTGHQMAWFQAHKGEVRCVRFGRHGYLLASSGADGVIRLWDMAQARPFGRPMTHGDSVYDLALHHGGGLLYSCSFDGRVGVWRLDNQALVDAYEDDSPVLAISPYPDDARVAVVTTTAVKILSFQHDPYAVKPPENFGGGAVITPGVSHAQSGVLVSDVDDAYLGARQQMAPPPQYPMAPPPGAPQGVVPLADMTYAPGSVPGMPVAHRPGQGPPVAQGALAAQGTTDSSPLIPARDMAAEKSSPDAELRRKREALVARRRGRFLLAGAFLACVLALMGAAVGYGTRSSPASDPQAVQQREAAERNYEASLRDEDQKHRGAVTGLQEQLDRARKNVGSAEIQKLIKQLEGQLEGERARHQRALETLESGRSQVVSSSQQEDPWAGASRAGIAGALAFFLTLIVAFVGSRVLIKDQ